MKNFLYLVAGLSLGATMAFTSCVSTDVMEPEIETGDDMQVVLNLSAPEKLSTRADANHKLRYIAKLFTGSPGNINGLQRKEILDGNRSEEGVTNQIIFNVPAGTTYTVYVIADYIPSTAQPDAKGLYGDYYYDTSTYNDSFSLLTTPGNNKTTTVTPSFFNNDNYDCFASGPLSDTKTEAKLEFNVELKRAVAKVRFLNTSSQSGSYDFKFSNLKFDYQFDQRNEKGFDNFNRNINLSIDSKSFSGTSEEEMFYFYTFAPAANVSGEDVTVKFNVTGSDNNPKEVSVDKIKVQRNHITSVKGAFLPSASSGGNGGGGDQPTPPENGPIYVNMSVDSQWDSQELLNQWAD